MATKPKLSYRVVTFKSRGGIEGAPGQSVTKTGGEERDKRDGKDARDEWRGHAQFDSVVKPQAPP